MDKRAHNFKNKVGARYGRLLVISFVGVVNRKSIWRCLCDCGISKSYVAGSLSTGRTKSCGCLSRETTAEFNRKTKTKVSYCTFSSVWQSYKKGAKDRQYEFSLEKDSFYTLTQGNCYYCGLKPLQERKSRNKDKKNNFFYNGIDRKDNDLGYTLDNCVSCCKHCNRMKMTQSESEFFDRIKLIYQKHCTACT